MEGKEKEGNLGKRKREENDEEVKENSDVDVCVQVNSLKSAGDLDIEYLYTVIDIDKDGEVFLRTG